MKPTIRRTMPADAPAILELGSQTPEVCYSQIVPFSTLAELEAEAESPDAFMAVAELDGRIVGYLTVDYFGTEQETWANLTSLAVRPEYRRAGVFAALYEEWLKDAKTRGVTYVCSYARAGHQIVEFFKRRGYSVGHDYTFVDKTLSFAR